MFIRAPPATFPRSAGKIPTITLPEDVYVKKFYKKYPESKSHDAIKYFPFTLYLVFVPFAMFGHLVLVSVLLYDVTSSGKTHTMHVSVIL